MINKIDDVINALRNDATLTTLLNKRVHWLVNPLATKAYPYITLFEVSNAETESADDEEYADEIEIQVDIWNTGSTTPISKQVQKVMRGLGFVHDASPDEYLEGTKVYHKPLRFTITEET
jgi:hypothetical protein